tara:strand:+ start:129 stop:413 length:285 start_codon:yes stop_codon:yes gene_type:complete
MENKKKVVTNDRVEVIDNDLQYRVCIDMRAVGQAEGGKFIEHKGIKEVIESIEASGINKMIGLVYDGTDRLEILTQNIIDNLPSDDIENIKEVD